MEPESEQLLQTLGEHTKLVVDVLKHLTTLASGAVVLIATFMDKVKSVHLRSLISWAIGFLLLCILSSMNGCFQLSSNYSAAIALRRIALYASGTDDHTKANQDLERFKKRERIGVAASSIAFGAFSLGMILIGVYVIGNF
jgi:hypothetical protein